jgi:hypothetical protein
MGFLKLPKKMREKKKNASSEEVFLLLVQQHFSRLIDQRPDFAGPGWLHVLLHYTGRWAF